MTHPYKHKNPRIKALFFFFRGLLYTAMAAFGIGLFRTRQAFSGTDISTLRYYFDLLKDEFEIQRVTGLRSLFTTYSVLSDTASASLKWAIPFAILYFILWGLAGLRRTRLVLHLRTRRRDLCLPLTDKLPSLCLLRRGVVLLLTFALLSIAFTVHLPQFLYLQTQESQIYDEDYVDPQPADIRFPSQKQNLIHIYLESIETTYEDSSSGGTWPVNLIPQLTALSNENISFSNLVSLIGTDYTSGALVAQTAGLPINREVSKYSVNGEFLPYAYTLHDILADEGYRQIFMCGSDGDFGARTLYFNSHGPTEVLDYNTAVQQGIVPDGYREDVGGWGLRDYLLLDWAKSVLEELSKNDQPFALSLLTVDTHFYDGVLCDYCTDEMDSQYENVIRCSDRLVSAFVRWCQEQPFYENTTIVISGDHPTMDFNFVSEHTRQLNDRGVYTCIIHPYGDLTPATTRTREASTFDIFPTTLAALGAQWNGDQLAFGVNLFSDAPTLVEQKGRDTLNLQLQMPADTYMRRFYHTDN